MKMNRIVPMLPVSNMPASVAYYEKLGFSVEQRNDEWRWALLRCGDCQLMVDESINIAPHAPRAGVLYLYPEDLAAYHHQVRANGVSVADLDVAFYGMTEFRIEDPDGNRLWIGQPAAAEV
ncbi:VOC family protein [Botrimarina hoheduenensis]|uniref:Glyoxalase-like domain protein n=1 Tax=Botrimarina hoheduenensis TaxID=2528000 RepID=A0A5C5VRN7_9BACT|nr:VOC family protein [Botrimarina hoheduenensis]TWT40232.1 Glyoxalase-like domain protein [Botrimarina hoheduenensis]